MPTTPNREHGELLVPDGLLLEGPQPSSADQGSVRYNGASFEMRDATGVFDPRTGGSPPAADYAFRRHFLLMGG